MWQARIEGFGAGELLEARPASLVESLGVQMRDRTDDIFDDCGGRTGGPEVSRMVLHTAQRVS